jgi:hypothetical protein
MPSSRRPWLRWCRGRRLFDVLFSGGVSGVRAPPSRCVDLSSSAAPEVLQSSAPSKSMVQSIATDAAMA